MASSADTGTDTRADTGVNVRSRAKVKLAVFSEMITSRVIDARRARHYRDGMDTMNIQARDVPADLDRDALMILRDAGFIWDCGRLAFRRRGSTIEYAFLRHQKLIRGLRLNAQERIGQLQRLRILLQSLD
jgi:hypothetical protein